MSADYELKKWVWDDSDFELMDWHDDKLHSILFGPGEFELSFDIDHIFKWVNPASGESYFHYWVSPCTLVFQNVYEVQFEI